MEFTIGTDPEFFVIEKKTGSLVKASFFTEAGKDDPELIGNGKEMYAVHADNVMLELNIPPAVSKKGFIANVKKGKKLLEKFIGNNYELLIVPSVDFPDVLLTDDQDFEINCDPDFDAYKEQQNEGIILDSNKRFAGGHVHVGLQDIPENDVIAGMVKSMDFCFLNFVGLNDKDLDRKKIYGTPGRFRFKEYGFEYRSMSNFWTINDDLVGQVYDITKDAISNALIHNNIYSNRMVKTMFQQNIEEPILEEDVLVEIIK